MARTIQQIYDALILEKQNQTELNALTPINDSAQTLLSQLTSQSRVAVWRVFFWTVATGIWTLEKILDVETAALEARARAIIPATLRWYRDRALEFQDGDALVWDGNKYVYNQVNQANRIVKYSAAIESNNQVIVKVATDSGGLAAALTSAQETRFREYLTLIKYAGTDVDVITLTADLVAISGTVFYDPLVLSSNGSLVSNPAVFPVEDAIVSYLKDLGTTNFNGVFRQIDLTDKIQAVSGVVNFIPAGIQITAPAPFNVLADPAEKYQSVAGHLAIDPLFPLSSGIVYTSA